MTKQRTSTYNKEADSRWAEKNRSHKNYLSLRSSAKSFVRNKATKEDLIDLIALIYEIIQNERDQGLHSSGRVT